MGLRLDLYRLPPSPVYLYQIGEAGLAVGVHDLASVCSVLWAWRSPFFRRVHAFGHLPCILRLRVPLILSY